MNEETKVPNEIKMLLDELVVNGILTYHRNEDGEPTFKMTDAGKKSVEDWMLESEDAFI